MNRYIKDYTVSDLTDEFILSEDWDVIEFNLRLDTVKLTEYFNEVKAKLHYLYFDFNYSEHLTPEVNEKFQTTNMVTNYLGEVGGWTISWPVEKDIPIPGRTQGNLAIYPELELYPTKEDFYFSCKVLKQYKFGYFNSIYDAFTEKGLRQTIFSNHKPGVKTLTHHDDFIKKKLHLPLETNPNAYFYFGKNQERQYQFELGKAYLINPAVYHSTDNTGNTNRTHLISRVDLDFMPTLFSIKGIV
jgi:hypothetical protein